MYFCPAKGIAAASFCEAIAEQKIERIARPQGKEKRVFLTRLSAWGFAQKKSKECQKEKK